MPTAEYMREYRQRRKAQGAPVGRPHTPAKRGRPASEDRKSLVQLRLRSSLLGRLGRIYDVGLAKGTHRWQSKSEMYADLIVRGLETYSEDEHVAETLQYLRAEATAEGIASHRKVAQALYARCKVEVNELLQIRAIEQARHYFWSIRADMQRASPNVWRDWFLAEWDRTFPRLLAQPPAKSALTLRDSEEEVAREVAEIAKNGGKERRRKARES